MDDVVFAILYSEDIQIKSWKQGSSERKRELFAMNSDLHSQVVETKNELSIFLNEIEVKPKSKVAESLVDTCWIFPLVFPMTSPTNSPVLHCWHETLEKRNTPVVAG